MDKPQRISNGQAIDLTNGDMHTICKHKHRNIVKAVNWDPNTFEGIYGSSADFCMTVNCEEQIDSYVPEFHWQHDYLKWLAKWPE